MSTSDSDAGSNLEREIFFAALDLADGETQSEYVLARCGDNRALADRVLKLLANSNSDPAKADTSSIWGDRTKVSNSSEGVVSRDGHRNLEFVEQTVGPYQILEKLGEGGSAIVYLAKQVEPIQRMVAIKIIKPGMESNTILSRFQLEKHTLTSLSHSNIASLLDAGTSPLGRPYLVLEFIDGTSITEYCKQQRLEPNQRLQLFLRVCEAVQYAHQKGVIHRDLKPSNILVANKDGIPIPKVIDFGIAKLLDTNDFRSSRTQQGQLIGTIEYMSPEQASLGFSPVDVRSDVYALACVLYELLTGVTPHAASLAKCDSLESSLGVVREGRPLRPLQQIRGDARTNERTSNGFGVDLDCIVMKGLEKSLDLRYSSVQAMIDDLRCYLNNSVVSARPPTALYLFQRFASRNRASIATASVLLSSILVALGVSIWGWTTTTAANEKTKRISAEALVLKDRAESTLSFFLEGLEKSKPKTVDMGNSPDMSVGELLANYLKELQLELNGDSKKLGPTVQSEVLTRLGRISYARYEPKTSQLAFEALIPLLEKYQPNDRSKIFEAKFQLASCYFIDRNLSACRKVLEEICPKQAATVAEGEAIVLLARTYLNSDKRAIAEEVLESIPASIHSARIDIVRGTVLERLGKFEEAFGVFTAVLNDKECDLDLTSQCNSHLSNCLVNMGRPDEGIEMMKKVVLADEGLFSNNHIGSMDSRGKLLEMYLICERYQEALDIANGLVATLRLSSPESPVQRFVPMVRLRIATCLVGIGQFSQVLEMISTEPILESSLRDREQYELHACIGIASKLSGKPADAESHFLKMHALSDNSDAANEMWIVAKRRIRALMNRHQLEGELH